MLALEFRVPQCDDIAGTDLVVLLRRGVREVDVYDCPIRAYTDRGEGVGEGTQELGN